MSKLIIEDEVLESENFLIDSPEAVMNALLNDNNVLSENQKIFIDKYLNNMDSTSSCSSAEL